MRLFRFTPLLILVLTLIGCEASSTGQRYLDVSLGRPLDVPPDLAKFEAESVFDLPQGFAGDDITVRDKVPVLAKVDTLQLQGSGDFYWLSVEDPVENLYQQVKNFWAFEGYGLIVDEPVIGVMETEWILIDVGKVKDDQTWWDKLWDNENYAVSENQFKTRIERDQTGRGINRIYIAYRSTEVAPTVRVDPTKYTKKLNDSRETIDWQIRRAEPELEVEMLSRLMVYLGLQKADLDEQLSQVGLFKPRAILEFDVDGKSPYLILKDPYHIAWNRIFHLLERLNFEIVDTEFKSQFIGTGTIEVLTDTVDTVESTGFFSFGNSDEKKQRKFKLVFSAETNDLTRVELKNGAGDLDTSPEGAEFLSLLFEQTK
ncbi:outer membrane protein assembly factor BamC [Gammaproteobacteria bacterium]|nr:outer membrane protein assembly factor BamC [Gammaproteobacteria bacterium]